MKFEMILLVVLIAGMASTVVSAANIPLVVDWVKWDGDTIDNGDTVEIERGEDLDLRVRVTADGADLEDVEIEAYISGYRYSHYEGNMISDSTRTFDLRNGSSDTHDLSLSIPIKMDTEDTKLRIRVSNKNDISVEYVYQLDIVGVNDENAVNIQSFTVSPSDLVEAGRPLSFKVKVKNYGDDSLDDISVRVAIPELGISDDETLDELDIDETETFEELLLRVPTCTRPGTYVVEATVSFDSYEETTQTMNVRVLENGACQAAQPASAAKTVVTVPESQEITMGTSGAVYPVMISNLGSSAKTYTIAVSGVDAWGTVRLDPAAVVVVQPESVKTVYMYVAANDDAQVGAQVFKLLLESEGDTKQVVLTANVKAGEVVNSDLRRGLEIGLIVLVIILIILGLIIGFNKLRGDNDNDDDETQTYY